MSWIKELRNTRNSWAHLGGKQPSLRDTWRALDTMSRLCGEIDQDANSEIETLIRTIELENRMASEGIEDAIDGLVVEQTHQIASAQLSPAPQAARRFMPKRDWTPVTLADAVNEWCMENGRMTIKGFENLNFADAAEATLAMPLFTDSEDHAFRKAADSIIFRIDDDKMLALTCPKDVADEHFDIPTQVEWISASVGAEELAANVEERDAAGQYQSNAFEQFEYLPKAKDSWDKDGVLEIAEAWAGLHARVLPIQVSRWRFDTLADMVLSKFPGQSDLAIGFNDASRETLFAPDTRKLYIITHK